MAETATRSRGAATINNAENAVAGKPPIYCHAGCQPCQRVGLQLLVVTPSVVPKEHAKALEEGGCIWPAPLLDTEFRNLKREGTVPVARISRAGYFVVIFPTRMRADVWQVAPDGLARKVMHQVNAEQYARMQGDFINPVAEAKSCSRKAANVPATLINIEHARDVKEAWVGYTPHLWAPSVFSKFLANEPASLPGAVGTMVTKPLREVLGRTLNPSAILGGQLPAGTLPINASSLQNTLADFAAKPVASFLSAFELALRPLEKERFGLAEEFASNVRYLEQASGPPENPRLYLDRSLIVMVDDPIGVMEQHNTLRLAALEAKRLWSIGGPGLRQPADPTRIWALRSSVHLDTIEQWEAALDAQRIVKATDAELHKNLHPVTEENFQRESAAGKYPKGTTWEPRPMMQWGKPKLDADGKPVPMTVASQYSPGTTTRLGNLKLPPDQVEKAANQQGADKAKGMQARLRGRVDMQQVSFFRSEFKAESDRWDQLIGELDRDFLAWRRGSQFGAAYLNQFDHGLKLTQPDPKAGTLDQQTADFAARLGALDKAMGGGAITIDSAKALAALQGLKPDDPSNWIDQAFHVTFGLKKEVWEDPGNRSEAKEGLVSLKSLAHNVRQSLAKQLQRHQLETTLASLLAVRSQIVNLVAAAVEKKTALALGIAAVSQEEARKALRVHIRVNLLAEELVDVDSQVLSRQKFVFNLKVPVGVALDEARDAMAQGVLPMKFAPKNETTRQERRLTERQFRKLEGRLTEEMNYPVLIDRQMLEKLQKEAKAAGEGLIEILPDAHLGMASGPIKVPQDVARRLIREQAVSVKQALTTGEGKILGAVGVVQALALWDTGAKITRTEGIEQADAVLSTVSTLMGMTESYATFRLHMYTLRADGARTLTVKTATSIARMRLGAGVFGALGSMLDSTLAFLRAGNAKRAGDNQASMAYYAAGGLYFVSGAVSIAGAFVTYQSFTASGLIVGAVGVEAAAVLGSWLMGIGIVLSIAAFSAMLYALYVAYHPMDIFLDRSYWGHGERVEGKFGLTTREQLKQIHTDKALNASARISALQQITRVGMRAEMEAFNALPLGLQTSFEWNKNWFSDEAVVFKVACGVWPPKRNISVKIELLESVGAPGVVVLNETGLTLEGTEKNDEDLLEWSKAWVFKNGTHKQYPMARVSYNIHGDSGSDSLTRDELLVKRDS